MVACDSSPSRVARLRECLQSYLPEAQLRKVAVLHRDILTPGNLGQQSYDKVPHTPHLPWAPPWRRNGPLRLVRAHDQIMPQ